jgi:flagellar basal-body rod protein FlgB
MISRLNSSKTLNLLAKGMDAASLRQRIIANNIANVDTPGFKISGVKFEDELKRVLDGDGIRGTKTDPRHMTIGLPNYNEVEPKAFKYNDTYYRNDKNNVDIDVEMAKMAKNSIYFDACVQRMNIYFDIVNTAIQRGGGR